MAKNDCSQLPASKVDLTGVRFVMWKVVKKAEPNKRGTPKWTCECDCGVVRDVSVYHLLSGNSTSCGCIKSIKPAPNYIDLTGRQFGNWTVLSRSGRDSKNNATWKCVCKCGTEGIKTSDILNSGHSLSCGCLKTEQLLARSIKHGKTNTSEFKSWQHMLARCFNETDSAYKRYGARGIRVCTRWKDDFSEFFSDMGPKPSEDLSIDRIDNDRGYTCGQCDDCKENGDTMNCRWATARQQMRNTHRTVFVSYDEKIVPLIEAAEISGIPYGTVRGRIRMGWTLSRALGREEGTIKCV